MNRLHLVLTKLLVEGSATNFDDNGVWMWADHDNNWIYQGGPEPTHNRDVYYNQ